jgi:hypothetical protein
MWQLPDPGRRDYRYASAGSGRLAQHMRSRLRAKPGQAQPVTLLPARGFTGR